MAPISGQALLKAVEVGDTNTIVACLDGGVPIETKDPNGDTALSNAAFNGQTVAAQLLLSCGANPNASTNSGGDSALMWAAVGGHHEIVSMLLKAGANGAAFPSAAFAVSHWHFLTPAF